MSIMPVFMLSFASSFLVALVTAVTARALAPPEPEIEVK